MPRTLAWRRAGLDHACQSGNMAILLTSLLFLFEILQHLKSGISSFVIVNISLPVNIDDYANRQLFLVKYILCIGVLPSGDKICNNKGIAKSVTFSLFCCVRVGYCIHLDAILLTQCLYLVGMTEHNLKKNIQLFQSGNL